MGNGDDTQRILEQKALANVRALVEKVEAEDRARSRNAVLLGIKLVPILVVGLVVLAVVVSVVAFWPPQVAPSPRNEAEYVEQLFAKIEKRANSARMRPEFENLSGRVRLRFVVRSKGYIDNFEVVQPSKNTMLDLEASRLAKSAEPFGRIPGDAGLLQVTSTFRFDRTGGGPAKLVIEREQAAISR